ncbi:hypothetical protein CH063_06427, partial [Colletotrichum higginsianum]
MKRSKSTGFVELRSISSGKPAGGGMSLRTLHMPRVVGALVLVAEQEVVEELRALLVRRVLEDRGALAPCDEEAVPGDGDVERGGGRQDPRGARVKVTG